MSNLKISRRNALLGSAAIAGASSLVGIGPAYAKAPLAKDQASQFYRFPIGEFQATIVSDGPLPLGEPSSSMKGITKEEIGKALGGQLPTPR